MPIPARVRRFYLFWAAASAPSVSLIYIAVAFTVAKVGCIPPFDAAAFFEVPVTFFLLTVLALTALIMVVFGVLHALRALRARAQRRRRDRFQRRLGAALIIVLGLVTFAFTAWVSDYFLRLSACL